MVIEKRFAQSLGSEARLDLPQTALSPDSGQRVYAANCASCHGARGLGEGPVAAALKPRPPALANAELMRSTTPELMFRKITIGVTGTAMPAFGDKLSTEDRWNVVAYLTELRQKGGRRRARRRPVRPELRILSWRERHRRWTARSRIVEASSGARLIRLAVAAFRLGAGGRRPKRRARIADAADAVAHRAAGAGDRRVPALAGDSRAPHRRGCRRLQ